jgi:hypothetical protein
MKLGVIIALSSDKKSGKVITGPVGYDVAVGEYKALVGGGSAPDASLPNIELWSSQSRAKAHKFKSVQPTQSVPAPSDTDSQDSTPAVKRAYGRRS